MRAAQEVKQSARMGRALGGVLAYALALPLVVPIALACGVREVLSREEEPTPPQSEAGRKIAALYAQQAKENHHGKTTQR